MGCGPSKKDETRKKKTRNLLDDQNKSQVLVFGMPDSGHSNFIKAIEKYFYPVGGFNQNPFVFTAVPTDRASRSTWVECYSSPPKVITAFFFADVSSPASVLLSIKTFNWLRSQIIDNNPQPQIVACAKNPKQMTNFTMLKEHLPAGIEASTFNEQIQTDIQKYVEFITGSAVKKAAVYE